MILRYVPPIKSGTRVFIFISFFVVALVLYLAFIQKGFGAFIVFSVIYAIFMLLSFISLSKRHYIDVDEENKKVTIQKLTKKVEIDIANISEIDLIEQKNAYILNIKTADKGHEYNLSGSLSFEEPPFIPFLRKIQSLNPNVKYGETCIKILKGESSFNPWSVKMYYSYWSYVILMIAYFMALLLFLNLLK